MTPFARATATATTARTKRRSRKQLAVADAIGAEHPSVHLSRSWRRSPAAFYDTLSRSENLCALSACDVEHSALGTGEAGLPRRGDEFSNADRSAGPRAT